MASISLDKFVYFQTRFRSYRIKYSYSNLVKYPDDICEQSSSPSPPPSPPPVKKYISTIFIFLSIIIYPRKNYRSPINPISPSIRSNYRGLKRTRVTQVRNGHEWGKEMEREMELIVGRFVIRANKIAPANFSTLEKSLVLFPPRSIEREGFRNHPRRRKYAF